MESEKKVRLCWLLYMHSSPPSIHTQGSYTESDGERCEVGRQQAEGHAKVVDEAIFHATVCGALHKGTAVRSADVHHKVTLKTQRMTAMILLVCLHDLTCHT